MGSSDFLNIIPAFVGIVAIIMGGIILASGRDILKYPFGLFSFAMGVWALFISVYLFVDSPRLALYATYIYYIAAAVLIYGFLLFSLLFTGKIVNSHHFFSWATKLFIPLLAISVIVVIPNFFITVQGGVGTREATLNLFPYLLYSIYFLIYLGSTLTLLSGFDQKKYEARLTNQVKLIRAVAYIFIPIGALFNLILPLFGNYDQIMIGPLVVLPIVMVTFYAMTKHSLFDVRLALIRTMTYILSIITLAGLYYVIIFGLAQTVLNKNIISAEQAPLNVITVLTLTFLFQPIKRFFDRLTNSVFYRDNYDIDDFIARISRILTLTTDLKQLLRSASKEIKTTLKAESAFFTINQTDTDILTVSDEKRHSLTRSDMLKLADITSRSKSIIVTQLLRENNQLKKKLEENNISVLLPLYTNESLIGFCGLGNQLGNGYTNRDLKALSTISDELVIAIQNALSVQEVKELNDTLKQRVDEATEELRASNAQLRRLDEAKDEFVSMASHQLRTPLTSVKGYISMVLEGDAGKVSAMQVRLLEEAFTSSERMVHLINDFLNVSRLQTGKFLLEQQPYSLAKLVEQEVDSLKTTAKAHGLKLSYRMPSVFPTLYIDEGKLRQVVMNFIDNAIYYSREETSIIIRLHVEDGDIVFEVKDTGIGVPKAEQAHLFTKFFRASNARKQRPDGTGVGLFLAKKIIVAHGGRMLFESTEGHGSTFGFRLPIKKLSSAPPLDTE